jgi:hypothetical protein
MWRLDVSSEAELEILEAALRYERERADLGFRFEAQVNSIFARVLENPFQFPEIDEGARRALVREFPYGCSSRWKAISCRRKAASYDRANIARLRGDSRCIAARIACHCSSVCKLRTANREPTANCP